MQDSKAYKDFQVEWRRRAGPLGPNIGWKYKQEQARKKGSAFPSLDFGDVFQEGKQ